MYVHTNMRFLVLGLLLGLLAGCAGAPSAPAIPQQAATSAPTAVPTETLVPPTATSAPTSAPTAVPTATSTAAPTATVKPEPTATPTLEAAATTCAPLPLDWTAPSGEVELYAVIGLAGEERLEMYACPGSDSRALQALEPHSVELRRVGEDREVEGLLWTPAAYGDVAGWVQNRYLARQYGEADVEAVRRAGEIVYALREQDWDALAHAVHPEKGVRFSPYSYVRVGTGEGADLVFGADELAGLAADQTVYRWGVFDGSGEPIDRTFVDYYARFVYDADFFWPAVVGLNEVVGAGNTINNVAEIYPQAQVIEYHLSGADPRYGGMDWRSLRLVLEQVGDTWYLVGIVHDEWTI